MNRFRKLGFINYDVGDNLHVHSSLLNIVLQDDTGTVHKGKLEPPREPGEPADKDRAKMPSLPPVKVRKKNTVEKSVIGAV
jgi:hypothetical protein